MKLIGFASLISVASAARYIADLGPFGRFRMTTSPNDARMSFTSSLRNIHRLEKELRARGMLNATQTIEELNYHLHQQWTNKEASYGIGGDECGAAIAGGHYDPYLGCGPASGQPNERCDAIDRSRTPERYQCSGAYDNAEYDRCEVGDLSGKYGPVEIKSTRRGKRAFERIIGDPLPALDWHFVPGTTPAPPERFASVIYHLGAPRVLCGRIRKISH